MFHPNVDVISGKMFRSADLPRTGRNSTLSNFLIQQHLIKKLKSIFRFTSVFTIYTHTRNILSSYSRTLSPQQVPQCHPDRYRYECNIQLGQKQRMIHSAKRINLTSPSSLYSVRTSSSFSGLVNQGNSCPTSKVQKQEVHRVPFNILVSFQPLSDVVAQKFFSLYVRY